MPRSAPTPCRYPGCSKVLDVSGYCDQHRSLMHKDYARARKGFDTEQGFYQSSRWRATRASFLRENQLCVKCLEHGVLQPAKVVDHIVPIKRGGDRFGRSNLQALCVPCHNAKTASETGSAPA
jgi:5-methylcytosine-specific restriction protein A